MDTNAVGSRLSIWAASLVESTYLVAMVIVPLFYNVYSHQTFEPDKIYVLRALAAVTLAAAIVWCVDQGRAAWTVAGRPLWRVPLVLPVLAVAAAYALATVCSIAPRLSLLGSYLRAQGFYTCASYVTVFLAIVLIGRERGRCERLVTALLLASVPVSVYAILQQFNLDPIDWGQAAAARVTSTAGNPIFVAALLLMVVPLTLSRILALRRHVGAAWTFGDVLHLALYGALLALQTAALLSARSRGPLVGFAFALSAFVVLAAVLYRRRWPVLVLGVVATSVLCVTIMMSVAPTSGAPTSAEVRHGFTRLGRIFALHEGSGQVRTLIWGALTELLRRDPVRALVGHGPETMLMAFPSVYPAALATFERPDVAPDRAHNAILDALVTAGVVGCAAEIMLVVAFLLSILHWLDIVTTAAQRMGFLLATLGCAIAGAVVAVVAAGLALGALGFGLGLAIGVMAYLGGAALQRAAPTAPMVSADGLLLAALLAAGLGHFVETQVGIGIGATRLYFLAYAGVAVAVGLSRAQLVPPREDERGGSIPPIVLGLITGLLFVVLTFDLYAPTVDLQAYGTTIGAICLATWLSGAALVGATRQWARCLAVYAAASIVPWLLFALVFAPWIATTRQGSMATSLAFGSHLAGTVTLVYAAIGAFVLLIAASLAWRPGRSAATTGRWQAAVIAVPALVVAAGLAKINLDLARADTLTKLGKAYERSAVWSEAVSTHERALGATPWRQEYAVNVARALIERGRQVTSRPLEQRDADAARAVELLEEMARRYPRNPDHPSNLARIYRKWARFSDAAQRAHRWERADAAYETALALWPNNPVLWNERALLYLERGQPQQTLATFEHSVQVNPRFTETYVRRALAFVLLQRFDAATADYQRARRWEPDMSMNAARLAALYHETRQTERALADAQAGLATATPEEAIYVRKLIGYLGAPPEETESGG